MCIQIWLFGTEYQVLQVISNCHTVNQVLANDVPDIILIEANMFSKVWQHTPNFIELISLNIIMLLGKEEPHKSNEYLFKFLREPFDRNDLLKLLDKVSLEYVPHQHVK